jgi:hypothetical protein
MLHVFGPSNKVVQKGSKQDCPDEKKLYVCLIMPLRHVTLLKYRHICANIIRGDSNIAVTLAWYSIKVSINKNNR